MTADATVHDIRGSMSPLTIPVHRLSLTSNIASTFLQQASFSARRFTRAQTKLHWAF